MADHVIITPGVGATIAADDCGSAKVQFTKLGYGGDGRLDGAVSSLAINVAGNGQNQIIAAVAGQTVRCYGFWFFTGAAVNVKWRSNTTDFHPAVSLLGNGAFWMLPPIGIPWFTTTIAEGLFLNLSAAIQVSGIVYYGQSA